MMQNYGNGDESRLNCSIKDALLNAGWGNVLKMAGSGRMPWEMAGVVKRNDFDVVLLPTFIQVEAYRKRQALEGAAGGLFGQAVTTFNAWIAGLWELYGDGRALVDSTMRSMVMRAAFAEIVVHGEETLEDPFDDAGVAGDGTADEGPDVFFYAEDSLTLNPGIASLAASCEQRAAGVWEYDLAVQVASMGETPAGLSAREGLFLCGIARYRELLGQLGLVELGEACSQLAERADEVFPRPLSVLMLGVAPLDWRTARFFKQCPQLSFELRLAPGADGVGPLPRGIRPRIAYPSGRYADAALVMELVEGLAPGERAVVTAADPLALYKQMEPALVRGGMQGIVQGQARFAETDFGRAYLLLSRLMHGRYWDPRALADVVFSPFAGFTAAEARKHDAGLRADRAASRDEWIGELSMASSDFADLVTLTKLGGAEAALDNMLKKAGSVPGRSPNWRAEQRVAIEALRMVRDVCDTLHATWRDAWVVLSQTMVSVPFTSVGGEGADKPQVLVTTQGAAAQLEPGCCELLVAADLTVDDYPLADKDDAADTLLAKLGLERADDALSRARRAFAALQKLPTREFVCVRPLNDAAGNPAYAAAMLEELADAYGEGDAPEEGIGADPFNLPDALAGGLVQRGEELLYENALAADAGTGQPAAANVGLDASGELPGNVDESVLLLPRRSPDVPPLMRSPSPSQVELYLECPYKWFVSRRLELERMDEGFGPAEKGAFAHQVFERFYRRFQEAGHAKVDAGNLGQARQLMLAVADEVQAEMAAAGPGDNRLVPISVLEEREVDELKGQLVDFLDLEMQLLPGFHPAYLEYAFDPQDAPEYAGCPLVGRVDRIDVDDAGRAVIIDYKGSVNPEHDIAGKDAGHPGKVQARMYAQAVKRKLGLDVVAALYVSYGKHRAVAGAIDSRAVESPHVPATRKEGPWCALSEAPMGGDDAPEQALPFAEMTFSQMLDETESLVADAIARMERGEIAPNPSTAGACKYCPVAACPGKGV